MSISEIIPAYRRVDLYAKQKLFAQLFSETEYQMVNRGHKPSIVIPLNDDYLKRSATD
jgi:hypothetical protein